MLHMKSISAVSIATFTAGTSVFLPPLANPVMAAPFKPNIPADQRGILGIDMTTDISAVRLAGICFLPDCPESGLLDGNHNMDINSDSKFCEDRGYVSSCPENTAKIPDSECYRDASYFKCSEAQWCKDNGYNTTSCSVPQYPSEQCPNGELLYKSCKTDSTQACKELGYTNSCPSGQKLKKNSGRCTYDSSYGTCCTPSGCPSYTSLTSSSYGTNGTDGCEYACYYTCDPNCPDGTSASDPGGCGGSTRNGCGNVTCYYPYQSCCSYTTTEAYCSAQCKYTSGSSCVKNGATYYSSCGSSKCGTGYRCSNGTCVSTCNYSYTSTSCAAQCKNVGSMSCVKDGTTYYESCGSSKCPSGQTCENGICSPAPTSGYCCGYSICGYNGTSHSNDSDCLRIYGVSCYNICMIYYPTCDDMQASCSVSGGTPVFQYCSNVGTNNYGAHALFTCETDSSPEECTYTVTEDYCSSQCKNVGSTSCVKDGTTYYESCGSSKCGTGYTCSNGTCTSTCNYTITSESCYAQCKNVGSMSCVKDGTTYYESCGSSKCGTGYTCSNGTCTSTCNYTITKESCEAQCKSIVGAISCVKDGTTYYETCGISLCSSGQTCENGICVSPAPASGDCCGYSSCGYYNGTSHSNDSGCQSEFGMSCYNYCMERFGVACSDMQTSCTASGGSLVFQSCYVAGFNGYFSAKFTCE